MKKALMVSLALLVFLGVGGAVFAENFWLDFTLVNYTDLAITELYVSSSDDVNWGDDVLGVDVLYSEDQVALEFDESSYADFWDIKAVDENGTEWTWEDLDLTEITNLYLYRDGKRLWAEWE